MTFIAPIRIATVLGTVALLAGLLATSAGAMRDGRSPDTKDAVAQANALDPAITAAIASHRTSITASDKRSPDTQDAVAPTSALDPAIAAAIASHRTSITASDKRSPDTQDAVAQTNALDPAITAAIASHRTSITASDKRSPDTRDATGVIAAPMATPQPLVVASDPFFDWTDAGIGAAAGFAIALLLGGMILLSHRGRHGGLAV